MGAAGEGAREAALGALIHYRRNGAAPGKSPAERFRKLNTRDAALSTRLFYGTLQNIALCDYYAQHYSGMKLSRIEPIVLDILRLSIYQILFLSGVPNRAAVSEGTKLAKKRSNSRAAGYVNALLRAVAAASESGALPPVSAESQAERLAIEYSHPAWLTEPFIAALGAEGAARLLAANNDDDVPATAQVNTLLTSAEGALESLERDGVDAKRHEWLDDCVEMRGFGDITALDAFKRGYIYVQDAAARLAVVAADPKPGMLMIDGCASPGGKSFSAAIAMSDKGRILACDLTDAKLRRVSDGARRLNIKAIETLKADSTQSRGDLAGKADIVLADVPCSGFGVIRKKPEIRYKTEESIAGLPDIQENILLGLSAYVKNGGVLLYSTCTFLHAENEAVIERFLSKRPEFATEGFALPGLPGSAGLSGSADFPGGMCTLWPHVHGTDGFYICKLRRSEW
ncbi:MAG: 16S rRNA (cytosine(967)-C(5))-methyltransferase RsmB [Oscillospiraceae bacterium]|jgi:16S rRNA (cytosine967-C5)-methyltransferase|nr:16S rRNA (cytosine(967)-C(5))-methyltransferase RsmB [Oscillospiraceae bacterium]